jgi:DNA anti-recombination protein RmuC
MVVRNPARIREVSGVLFVLLATLAFGVLFYRMVASMEAITVSVGRISDDVASMSREMTVMRESMQKMEGHMQQLGATMGQGAREMQRVNPMRMMEGMSPGAN